MAVVKKWWRGLVAMCVVVAAGAMVWLIPDALTDSGDANAELRLDGRANVLVLDGTVVARNAGPDGGTMQLKVRSVYPPDVAGRFATGAVISVPGLLGDCADDSDSVIAVVREQGDELVLAGSAGLAFKDEATGLYVESQTCQPITEGRNSAPALRTGCTATLAVLGVAVALWG